MLKSIGLLIGLLFLFKLSPAQTPRFKNYTDKDGLPVSKINALFQDSKGYLWIGTSSGISRFDGKRFKNFSKKHGLPNNYIYSIWETQEGTLLAGSANGGLSSHQSGRFSAPLTLPHRPAHVLCFAEEGGGPLWLGTEKGLYRIDGKNIKAYTISDGLPANIIRALALDREGNLWIGTSKGAVGFVDGNFTHHTHTGGLTGNYISAIYIDPRGSVWFGTRAGISRLHNGSFVTYTTGDGLCHNHVTSITGDKDGNLWVGTYGGLSRFSGGTFTSYTTANGLPNNFINTLCTDREGNTWIGTTAGLSRLNNINVKVYSKKDGLPADNIWEITGDGGGNIWMTSGNGLSHFRDGRFKNYTKEDGLISNSVNTILATREGHILAGTVEGISILTPRGFTNYTEADGLTNRVVFTSMESRDNTIWIGTKKGLCILKKGAFSSPPIETGHLQVVYILEDRKGNIWFASDNGLYRYRYPGKTYTRFTTREGLPDNVISTIFQDRKGRIWVGTDGGLGCYRDGRFLDYSREKGLPADSITFILEDLRGNLWLGTTNGLLCFDGVSVSTYTSLRHSLPTDKWFTAFKDANGDFWLGGAQGLTFFSPPPVLPNLVPPPIHLTGVKVLEKPMPMEQCRQLTYKQNHFRIDFTGICLSAPESVVYKYRLEGLEEHWTQTADRSVFYPYLPPRNYRFLVKAVNNDGVESTAPAELPFTIRPPFWNTIWFRGLYSLAVSLLLIFFFRWRLRRGREKAVFEANKAELEARNRQLIMSQRMELMGNLAAGTMHDLKNLLSVILGYSMLGHQDPETTQNTPEHLEVIRETTETAMKMAKQILSFARPREGSLDDVDLVSLVYEILNILKLTQPPNITIQWQPPDDPVFFPIDPGRFQQVVMNLCMNALQAMPGGGTLAVSIRRAPDQTSIMEISDTGHGIEEKNLAKIFQPLFTTKEKDKGSGIGLFVVKQIVEEYNGAITVSSHPEQGATFIITFR